MTKLKKLKKIFTESAMSDTMSFYYLGLILVTIGRLRLHIMLLIMCSIQN